jgi:uncharacterized repeat protein (TIGR01451 family)
MLRLLPTKALKNREYMKNSSVRTRRAIIFLFALFGLTSSVAWPGKTTVRAGLESPPAEAGSPADRRRAPVSGADRATRAQLDEAYGRLPLSFEANRGQADARVRFISRASGARLFLTADEAVLALPRRGAVSAAAVRMKVVNADPAARPEGLDQLDVTTNYFKGHDPNQWHTNVPAFARVRYPEVYPGVSLVYYGNQRQLEYDFVIAAGSDPCRIKLAFAGAQRLRVNAAGELVLRVAGGELRFHKPVAYQEGEGGRQTVEARYRLKGRRSVSFKVGNYDRNRRLVIDPVLSYSTYLGGGGADNGHAIALDASGNAYVTGQTASANFPVSGNTYDATYASGADVFVTKINANGSALDYSTYLGGSGDDIGYGVAIDASGNAYVTGSTGSTDFPTTPGAFQGTLQGGSLPGDAFVTKLNPTGTALVYSTYLGGASADQANAIAVDSLGSAYVAGYTTSPDFPTTAGAFQTIYGGGGTPYGDAFVTKLNLTGGALAYSTFLGGANADTANGIKVDDSGNAYVAGITRSSNFPTTAGAFQTTYGGLSGFYPLGDAFATKLNTNATALVYSTFLGGAGDDGAFGIDLSPAGEVYLTGTTFSINFPTTTGALRVVSGGVARSANSGASWAAAAAGLDDSYVYTVAIHPSTPNVVYAGTDSNATGRGAFKSTDSGATWSAINSGLTDRSVRSLAIDPATPTRIYLGTNQGGAFRSTDGGSLWQAIAIGQDVTQVATLKIDPTNHLTVYAGTNKGVFKTIDGGDIWTAQTMGLPDGVGINSLAVAPSNPAIIYAGIYVSVSFGSYTYGLYQSTNGGASWASTALSDEFNPVNALAIDPAQPSIVYAGLSNDGVFRSTDGGSSWSDRRAGLTNRSVRALALSPADSSLLYAGTDAGVFKSTDGGNLWIAAGTGLAGTAVYALAMDPLTPSTIYSGINGGINASEFVAKLNAAGTAPLYSTYLGGDGGFNHSAIAADSSGNVFVAGYSESFPPLPATAGGYPVKGTFVTKLNAAANAVVYTTGLGKGHDLAIAVDASGSAYVTGSTLGGYLPVTPGAFQPNPGGGIVSDAFVSKLVPSPNLTADLAITMGGPAGPIIQGVLIPYPITIINNGPEPAFDITLTDVLPSSASVVSISEPGNPARTSAATSNYVSMNIGSLPPGGSQTRTIYVQAHCAPDTNSVIDHTVSVTSSSIDPTPGNNSDTTTTDIKAPTPTLSPTSSNFPAAGGNGQVTVNFESSSCRWMSKSDAAWITITQSDGWSGGRVFYTVAANGGGPRADTMTIAGETFTVTQAGTCNAAPTTSSAVVPSYSTLNYIDVVADPGCPWMAVSNDSWIVMVDGTSGSGNGTVSYYVQPSGSPLPRFGTITVADHLFTVKQRGDTVKVDFDRDRRSDIGYYRDGLWSILQSSENYNTDAPLFFSWGRAGLPPIVADFDGDGRADIGYVEPPASSQSATYAILLSSRGYSFAPGDPLFVPAGYPSLGDTPVIGDFDGDGKADPGVWRASQGVWIIPTSSSNYTSYIFAQWGQPGDVPMVGDFDGDGEADIGYYRDGVWGILQSSRNYSTDFPLFFSWGRAGVPPIVADFDADGVSDLAYIEPPTSGQSAAYAILLSSRSYSFAPGDALFVPAGYPSLGDTPVVASFDGDRRANPGIWRASQGVWIIPTPSSNYTSYIFVQWGQPGDVPLPTNPSQQ